MARRKKSAFKKILSLLMIVALLVVGYSVYLDVSEKKKGAAATDDSVSIAELEKEAAELQAELDYYRGQLEWQEWQGRLWQLEAQRYYLSTLEYLEQLTELRREFEFLKLFAVMPVSFAVDSWALISVLSKNGLASEYYNIGDEKDIVLKTGEVIIVQILGFDHDIVYLGDEEMLFDEEGNELGWSSMPPKMAGITLGMKDLLTTSYKMESTNTNANGWMGSLMRNDTMQTLFTQLPTDLQAVIQPVLKTTSVGGAQSGILDMAYDSLWLFSEEEIYGQTVFGTNGISNTVNGDKSGNGEEGKQYEYWQQKNGALYNTADSTNRIKNLANGTGAPSIWWLRSPYALIASNFCIVNETGLATNAVPNTARGICFGFAV